MTRKEVMVSTLKKKKQLANEINQLCVFLCWSCFGTVGVAGAGGCEIFDRSVEEHECFTPPLCTLLLLIVCLDKNDCDSKLSLLNSQHPGASTKNSQLHKFHTVFTLILRFYVVNKINDENFMFKMKLRKEICC